MQTAKKNSHSLAALLDPLWKKTPGVLLNETPLNRLKETAKLFPPILRMGLECRMSGNPQVDLQICIRRENEEANKTFHFLQQQHGASPEWQPLLNFIEKWKDENSTYYLSIEEIFLEADVLQEKTNVPLLFFSIDSKQKPSGEISSFTKQVIKETVGEQKCFYPLLDTCLQAIPENARLSHVGIIFSRSVEALRINIKDLYPAQVLPFLNECGYKYISSELDNLLFFLYRSTDRITLCIDLSHELLPRVGFECMWNTQPAEESLWKHFLEHFTAKGCCRQAKCDAILNWDEQVIPTAGEHFPEQVWMESLNKKPDEFAALLKKTMHLKVSHIPQQMPEVKAYLGFGNIWKTTGHVKTEQVTNFHSYEKPVSKKSLDIAINKSVNYILSKQLQSGYWKEFKLPPGTSDEWVTAYIAAHIAPYTQAKNALQRAWSILQSAYRENKGWGHNSLIPADADSSIWVRHFIKRANIPASFEQGLFEQYIDVNGGVVTYSEKEPIRRAIELPSNASFKGWQQVHECVTAAYALAGFGAPLNYMEQHQQLNGNWKSYWWRSDIYATALAAEALFEHRGGAQNIQVVNAVKWTVKQLSEKEHTAFDLALLLRILLLDRLHYKPVIDTYVEKLLGMQLEDGSWPASAALKVPMPYDTGLDEEVHTIYVNDEQRSFTSATVLDALHKYSI